MQSLRDISRDIFDMIDQVLRASEPPIDIAKLADLRKRIGLAHNRLFAEQERLLLQPLRTSGDPELAAIARCCVERDLELRRAGLIHYQRWTLARVQEDPDGYRADLRDMLRNMKARAAYADQFAYPALARLISSAQRTAAR